jgi:amidase
MYELKHAINAYLAQLPSSPIKTLADIIKFNDANAEREMRWFGQESFLFAQDRGPLTSPAYMQALTMVRNLARDDGIDATMKKHSLDAMVAPTQSPAWISDPILGDTGELGAYMCADAAGYPCISVPAGDVAGLPVGMLFFGTAWSEPKLLRYAHAFEQIVNARRPPHFLPSVNVRP